MSGTVAISNATSATQDRLLRISVGLLGVTLAIVVFGGLASFYKILNTETNTSKTQDGIDIQGCRSLFNADVVAAQGNASAVILAGLYAVAAKDDVALNDLLKADPKTNKSLYEVTVEEIYKSRDAYRKAVDESNQHPESFIARCKAKQAQFTTVTTRPVPTTNPGGN